MDKFVVLVMFVFLFVASIVYAVPQNLNVDFQVHNDTGVARNTSYSGTVRIYELGSGSPTYSQNVQWRTDNSGVGNLFLTNVNLLNDVQHEITIQPTGESESGRLNISGNLQAIFAANSTYSAGVSCSDIDGATSNLCTLTDTDTNTQLTQEQVEDFAGAMAANGNGVDLTYSDGAGTLTPSFDCSDVVGGNLTCSGETIIAVPSSINFNDLLGIPSGLSDGDDDTIFNNVGNTANFTLLFQQGQNGTTFVNEVNTSLSARLNGFNSSSTTDELYDDSAILSTITVITFNLSDINSSLSARIDNAGSSFDNSGNTANFTTLFAYSLDNATHLAAQNLTLEQLIGFNCGAGDFVNAIGTDGLPSCGTPVGGGGGAGDKWLVNSSLNAVVPNESFSGNIATLPGRFINASLLYSSGLESGTQQNITVSESGGVWSFIVALTSFNWNDLTNIPSWITTNFDTTIQSWISGNVTIIQSNTDTKVLDNSSLVNDNTNVKLSGNLTVINSNTDNKVISNRSAEAANTDLKVLSNVTTDTTLSEAQVEAMIFDTDNTGQMTITDSAAGNTLFIDKNGDAGGSTSTGGTVRIDGTGNIGASMIIYSNLGSTASGRLLNIRADNVDFDQAALHVDYDGNANGVEIVCGPADTSSQCLNIVSGNANDTTISATANTTSRAVAKFVHTKPSDNDAGSSAISAVSQGSGTGAHLYYGDAEDDTTGDLLNLRNSGVEQFVVDSTGNTTISAGLVVEDNASINGLFIGKINSTHWRIG